MVLVYIVDIIINPINESIEGLLIYLVLYYNNLRTF